jgi:hypothetical protein
MQTIQDARNLLSRAWPHIQSECRAVLGGELHYQAMIYHALRLAEVPLLQIGMNVKQYIENPSSALFSTLADARHQAYRGGFEPIPDVVLFGPRVGGDWRRRNRESTLRNMLLALEVKASERAGGRLSRKEVSDDIRKLAAHREEVCHLGSDMQPVMLVIDTAPLAAERMRPEHIAACQDLAKALEVDWLYLDRERSLSQCAAAISTVNDPSSGH